MIAFRGGRAGRQIDGASAVRSDAADVAIGLAARMPIDQAALDHVASFEVREPPAAMRIVIR